MGQRRFPDFDVMDSAVGTAETSAAVSGLSHLG